MRKIVASIICFTSLRVMAVTAVQAPSAESLLVGWRNAIYTDHEHSKLELSLIDPQSGALQRRAEIWYKSGTREENRILMRFASPASIRGLAFLSIKSAGQTGADQWLYVPAYKKSRRLSSHRRDEAFLDSDFTNGDVSFEYEDAFTFRVTRESKLDGQDVYLVEGKVKPAKREGIPYAREVLFISKKENLNLRSEFYDAKGTLLKTLKIDQWKKYGNRWSADLIEVENVRTKHRSVIHFLSRDVKATPADRLFTLGELESGK